MFGLIRGDLPVIKQKGVHMLNDRLDWPARALAVGGILVVSYSGSLKRGILVEGPIATSRVSSHSPFEDLALSRLIYPWEINL